MQRIVADGPVMTAPSAAGAFTGSKKVQSSPVHPSKDDLVGALAFITVTRLAGWHHLNCVFVHQWSTTVHNSNLAYVD